MNDKSLVLLFLVATVLSFAAGLFLIDGSFTGQVTASEIEDMRPSYTNILATVYYTVESEDKIQSNGEIMWSNPEAQERYDLSTDKGFCVMNKTERGFYEEVRCQGSGIHKGQLYNYATVKPTEEESSPVEGIDSSKFSRGVTKTNTNPTPKRTVAVNPVPGSTCCINYDSEMYINFGRGHPWSGTYVAEDTGSAFRGECKIDIYAGVGNEELERVRGLLDSQNMGKNPEIYLLDDDAYCGPGSIDAAGNSRTPNVRGSQKANYKNRGSINDLATPIFSYQQFVSNITSRCGDAAYEAKSECFTNTISDFAESNNLEWNEACKSSKSVFNTTMEHARSNPPVESAGIVTELTEYDDHFIVNFIDYVNAKPHRLRLDKDTFENGALEVDGEFDIKTFNISEDLREDTIFKLRNNVKYISSDELTIAVDVVDNIIFNPLTLTKELVREPALKIADCAMSTQNNCTCNFEIDSVRGIQVANNIISPINLDADSGVTTLANISRGSITSQENEEGVTEYFVEKFDVTAFNIVFNENEDDKSEMIIYRDEEGELFLLQNREAVSAMGLDMCELEYKHELVCLGPANRDGLENLDDVYFKYSVQI